VKPTRRKRSRAGKVLEAAVQPIGQTIERALDPLAEVLKRAALRRADRDQRQFEQQPEPKAKSDAELVSPLAAPFPDMPDVKGVEVATGRAGLYPKKQRDDLLVMRFSEGTTCAGVFTQHAATAAPVDWCKRHLAMAGGGHVRALVVNAGCANAFTGKPGADAARRVAAAAAKRLDCRQREVMLASTGVIGVVLDDAKIVHRLIAIGDDLSEGGWEAATRAIMTTDTFPKGACAEAVVDGAPVRIAGITKGSGMIAPNMATMLAFIVTDAAISATALQTLMTLYTRSSFNAVTVDGDRSTNDCCMLFATGKSGAPLITRAGDRRLADFRRKLEGVMLNLAQQLVKDGEGATKFVQVTVQGAQTAASARKIARTICESPLVKTAIAGEDANWGRIVAAAGRADEPVSRERLSIRFGDLVAAQDGAVAPNYDEAKMSAYMKRPELEITVDVGVGHSSAVMWTCDLTKRYVEINGDYRS
jgi:glutamate N-acetyltransferase/amino-acid N-acetyltransferase